MLSSLLTVVPLSVDKVQALFEKTSDLARLCGPLYLELPDDKWGDAATAAEYYVNNDTRCRGWRWLIWWLDHIGDTDLANSIMEYAEPPEGV